MAFFFVPDCCKPAILSVKVVFSMETFRDDFYDAILLLNPSLNLKVCAVQNVNNSSGNFGFLTQMGDRIIQPLITVIKIYKTPSIGDLNYY